MQGFNMGRYVPPDLEGTTSFNAASGKGHALGARARKLKTEGILVVRFECPFAIWCTNCQPEQIIGQGVRFNAEKKKVGNYYTTPVWSFRFKHTVCGGWIEVRTDPKNAEYLVTDGGRRRDTGEDKLREGEIWIGKSAEEKDSLEKEGGFGSLEKKVQDKVAADTQKVRIDELKSQSEKDWADPYEMNRRVRKEFRVGRRQRQADEKSGEFLQNKFGLGVDVVAPSPEDTRAAQLIEFGGLEAGSNAAKPMFEKESRASKLTSSEKPGKRSKPQANESQIPRLSLQARVSGVTRSLADPFLQGQSQWQPNIKRKRIEDESPITSQHERQLRSALVAYASDSE